MALKLECYQDKINHSKANTYVSAATSSMNFAVKISLRVKHDQISMVNNLQIT